MLSLQKAAIGSTPVSVIFASVAQWQRDGPVNRWLSVQITPEAPDGSLNRLSLSMMFLLDPAQAGFTAGVV